MPLNKIVYVKIIMLSGPSKELSGMRANSGEVVVVALIVVVWLVLIALFLLRWSRQNGGPQLHYRCVPTHTLPVSLLVRHDGQTDTPTVTSPCLDESVSLLSEIELDDMPEDASAV